MCYHEQLIFKCGCTARNIVPCPQRLHLERASTVNWRRVHKLTRVCPRLEHDQMDIDIDCEVCGLLQQDVKPFTDDYPEYATQHAEMHQRLLGRKPSYVMLREPTWGWLSGTFYTKRDQALRRRVITAPGIRLRFAEVPQQYQRGGDYWRGWSNVDSVSNAPYITAYPPQQHGPGLLQRSCQDSAPHRPPMMPPRWFPPYPPRPQWPLPQHSAPYYPVRPQVPPPGHYPPMPTQYSQHSQHSQQPPDAGDQQRSTGLGWEATRLEPRTFAAPPMPSYHNPFASATTKNNPGSAPSSDPSSNHLQHSSDLPNTNEEFNRYPHPNLTDYYKRYPNNPPPPSVYGTGYSNYGGKGPATASYGGYGQQKRGLENQLPTHAVAKRRRLEDRAWHEQYRWNDPITAANIKCGNY